MDEARRRRYLSRVRSAHAELVAHLDELTGERAAEPALPSLLPGWTRGHLLTHVARNADGMTRMLEGVEQGERWEMYPGGAAARNAAIADGARREWLALVADVAAASQRLEQRLADQTRWDGAGDASHLGVLVPAADIPALRLREVYVHHADLGVGDDDGDGGYTPEDWPAEYVREDVRLLTMRWDARKPMGGTGLPDAVIRQPERTRLLWLLGRADIDGVDPAGIF